jgi:hypothetical protein
MHTIILSAEAFRQIVSSALEAYAVPHGRRKSTTNHLPLETCGSIWGYRTEQEDESYFHVVAADPETSAERKSDYVINKVGANRIKAGFYRTYSPELCYLGDFHSHPYWEGTDNLSTAQHVEKKLYYRFSGEPGGRNGDFASVRELKKGGLRYQVGLVVTVYKLRNKVKNRLHGFLDGKSVVRFTYNGVDSDNNDSSYRCWIKAYIFENSDDSPASDKSVKLQCATLGLIP